MDVNTAVSSNLKAIREKKKLSLDSVSKLTGVSKSMLGQIERGEVNPTISVLWKIANGMKISFTALLEEPARELEVIRGEKIQPVAEGDGRYLNYPTFAFDESRRFETYRIEILPGGSLQAQPHMAGTEELLTLFAGTARVTVDGREFLLENGDSLRFRADVPHSYSNPGQETVWISMMIYYG
jgi:transcriptional regulator with XRE-family HTH domain